MSDMIINAGRIFDAVYRGGNPDRSKGFGGWQTRAQATRKGLLAVKEAMDSKLKELKETYTVRMYNPMYEEMQKDYSSVRESVVKKLLDDLDGVVAEKHERYAAAALTAPTPDQLRLIEALNFRDDLTYGEISKIASNMAGNLQAMKALGGVVRSKGMDFPRVKSDEAFENDLNSAVEYAKNMLTYIDYDRADLTYYALEFFEYADPKSKTPPYFDAVDAPVYSAVQLDEIGKEPSATAATNTTADAIEASDGESTEMWSEVTLTGHEWLHALADQFHVGTSEIRQANPEVDFTNLHKGQKIFIPSTRMQFLPDQSGTHVQPERVRAVPRPAEFIPVGPGGAEPGDDIAVS